MIASRFVPVAVFAVVAASLSVGCKTKVDPNAFDAGAAAVPSTDPSAAATAAADTTVDAGAAEALAPLATSTKPVATAAGTAAKPKPTASAAPDPAECVAARAACGGANGAALTLQARKKCNDATSACIAKGGHL